MRTISKGAEPCCLKAWKRKNPHGAYDDLDKTEEGKVVRAKIRDYALNEQFYLCAYCCRSTFQILLLVVIPLINAVMHINLNTYP